MTLDERARRAAAGVTRVVDERTSTSPAGSFDRFEAALAVRRRRERASAVVVAMILAIGATALAVHALSSVERPRPAAPFPTGLLIVGDWSERPQLARWYTVGTDGTRRTDLGVTASCAVWFPDGSRILITDDTAGRPLRPAVVMPDGTGRARLDGVDDRRLNLGCGDVSPDGRRVVVEGFNDARRSRDGIYSIRSSDGGGLRRLTRGIDGVPRYSPDGSRLVFFREKLGLHPDSSGALFVIDADGTGLRRITPWGGAFLGQEWSPDGAWIVFQRPFGLLSLVRPDGSGLHTVPVSLPAGTGAVQPSWSADGRWILFALQRGDASTIYAVRPDGSGLRPVTSTDGALESWPGWRPG